MRQEPRIEERAAQHYAGIQATVPMEGISGAIDEAFPELFGWLAKTGTAPAGPPSSASSSSTWKHCSRSNSASQSPSP